MKIHEERVPMKRIDHPKEDNTSILNNDGHRLHQSILGMLQWVVSIGHIAVCYAVS